MSEPFLGEMRIVSFKFAPKGWALCNGQILPISQNTALFSLLGTFYGGDGVSTFALPNLQGSVPVHTGTGFALGQSGGEVTHTLVTAELPTHNHLVQANPGPGTQVSPAGNYPGAIRNANPFSPAAPSAALGSTAVGSTGGGEPHDNMPPYLVLNYIIALQGIFPSQS